MSMPNHRRPRAGTMAALAMAFATVTVLSGASTASAATVNGCAQGGTTMPGTCIWVDTGTKNSSNHTQWVSQITVQAPRGASSSLLEAWAGNGPSGVAWYRSGNGTYVTWPINQWIKTNSGICGAYTWPGTSDRSIACITITV
ncbi:hypothetical protein GCM10010335_65000 [Streptomyces galbus]|nr:hypothetical protein GCM10010335_65000 [Streptomyces galbus]